MSVEASQLRTVQELMERRRMAPSEPTAAQPSGRRFQPSSASGDLHVVEGPAGRRAARSDLDLALGDIVLSASAVDGAVAVERGSDLLISGSAHGLIGRRTIAREMSALIWEAIDTGRPHWLSDPAASGIHLPPQSQVLALPFKHTGREAVALLVFHRRHHFSHADLSWLTHVLTAAATRDAVADRGGDVAVPAGPDLSAAA